MNKFVNLPLIRQRLAKMAEQICEEEGLDCKVEINIADPKPNTTRAVRIEVVEAVHKEPKEVVN